MSPTEPAAAAASNHPDQPMPRARRMQSERSQARRAQVLEHLVEPPVVAEDVILLTKQANDIYHAFKPRNGWQDWLTSEIATIMVRINRCSRIERRMRDWASYRAIDFWEDDQKLEVETLALKLGRAPGKVVAQLRQMPAGLDWLLRRWRFLAQIEPQDWTDDQRGLAERLVGDREVDVAAPGFVLAEIAELDAERDQVAEADEIIRGLVESDLCDEKIPGLTRLRRYSRSLHRQMKWYVDQFHIEHPDRWDDPMRQPAFVSRELIRDENARKPHWSFKPAESESRETNPAAVAPVADPADHEIDETKPFEPAPSPQFDKTKPTVRGRTDRITRRSPGIVGRRRNR